MLGPQLPKSEWTLEAAAHLLNRAAFGGAPHHIQMLHRMGHEKAVDFILTNKSDHVQNFDAYNDAYEQVKKLVTNNLQLNKELSELPKNHFRSLKSFLQKANLPRGEDWRIFEVAYRNFFSTWFSHIIVDPFCSKDKLAFFWMNHFPVERDFGNVSSQCNYIQIMREVGGGKFIDLLKSVCKTTLMFHYLDLNANQANNPNENFARELMELFTIGEGHYTEDDIQQITRVFTGLYIAKDGSQFGVNEKRHDDGIKTVFGQNKNFSPDEIFEMLSNKKECSELIATKLWKYYVSNTDDVSSEELGELYRNCEMVTTTFLKQVFLSQKFYSKRYVRTHIKTPMQLVVQTIKQLEIPTTALTTSFFVHLNKMFVNMNFLIFNPPSVKGWPNGTEWITPATLLSRYKTVRYVVQLIPDQYIQQLLQHKLDKKQVCDLISARLFNAPASTQLVEKFVAFTKRHGYDSIVNKKELLSLLMATPHYQLT